MVNKVEAYKCSDGALFVDGQEAATYQCKLDQARLIDCIVDYCTVYSNQEFIESSFVELVQKGHVIVNESILKYVKRKG